MKRFLVLAVVAIFLSGCADPKIDTSTEDIQKKSIEKVRSTLSEQKRTEFDDALKIILFSGMNLFNAKETEYNMKNAIQSLHGKTGNEVIAEGNRIKEERATKEKERVAKQLAEDREKAAQDREQVLKEIKELETKKAIAETSKAELSKFKIISARYYKKDKKFMDRIVGKEPAIELKVRNDTSYPVSRAYFIGTITSPGRSVAWLKEEFNYPIKGGMEPKEEQVWNLAPNPYSVWGTVQAPDDAVLTVETTKIDGADGKALFDSEGLLDSETKLLEMLKTKLAKIDSTLKDTKTR